MPEPQKTFDLKFDLKPKDIKEYLDRYVIKQDEAKKALAIAVCDHYNHVRECHENPDATDTDYSKQNIVMLGPTGVGKTYLIRHIAKLIGVPFVKADATRFSETGYVGANVDDLIRELVAQAEDNLELAQYGIIYLDEADKIATPPNIIGRDVSGRGVQIGLLKLMEETEVDLSGGHDVASQMRAVMEFQKRGKVDKQVINTRHILFIISGAFTGMEDIIKKRMHQSRIGFSVEVTSQKDAAAEYFAHVTPKDFIDFGFEPEFIGRLPVHVVCTELEVDDLYHILKHSEGSIIRQYENAFRAYGINVLFSDNGLQRIAEKAIEQKTGARALMTVCEKILRNYKFELPSTGVVEFVVTADVVDTPDDELKKIMSDPEYNRTSVMKEQIRRYEGKFHADHDLKIEFDDDAVKAICQSAIKQELSIQQMCDEILKSYQHGLNLIKQNTGQTAFSLPKQVVDNPDPILEKWIRDSYHTKDEAKE
ncbi:AAA domain-containing protein [Candidatus Poribacteria bacterium]|nr:AAA domain-containing protein [Candidatus Poribacteria bacterium]